jgi:hypothetical protein
MSHEDFEYLRRKAEEERRRREIQRRKRLAMLNGSINATMNSIRNLIGDYSSRIHGTCAKAKNNGISQVTGSQQILSQLGNFQKRLDGIRIQKPEDEDYLRGVLDSLSGFMQEIRNCSVSVSNIESRIIKCSGIIANIRDVQKKIESQFRFSGQSCSEIEAAMKNYAVDSVASYNQLLSRFDVLKKNNADLGRKSIDTDNISELEQIESEFNSLSSKIAAEDSSFTVVMDDVKSKYSTRLTNEISDLIEKIRVNEEIRRKEKADAESIARKQEEDRRRSGLQEKKLKIIELARREFDELLAEPFISSKIYDSIQELLSRFNVLKDADNFELSDVYAISIQPRIKSIRKEIDSYKKLAEKFNEEYAEYMVLAQYCDEEPKDFALSESSIPLIQAEITRLHKAAARKDAQLYTAEAIRKSLEEMGYELIGEEQEIPDSILSSRLYRDSRGNGLNAIVRSDGTGSFEFGALSMQDRELTYDEKRRVAAETKSFCSKHRKLNEILEANGMPISRQVRMAPVPDNAILINASSFNVNEAVQKDIIRNEQASMHNAAASEQNVLHVDE